MKARVIHPSFFTDVKVSALSPNAKVLLLGLWLRCDDYGRADFLPKLIEGQVFPAEKVEIDALLGEVVRGGLIRIYEVGGQRYYDVPNWEKWQNPKYRKKSPIPAYPEEIGEISPEAGQNPPETGESSLPVLGLGLVFEKGLEDVSQRDPGSFRQMWRKREQQRKESPA